MAWLRRPGYFAPPAVLGPREDRLLLGLNDRDASNTSGFFDARIRVE